MMNRWLTFLRNHREAIAAMDSFTVPTLTFGVLYWHADLPIMPTSGKQFPHFPCLARNSSLFQRIAFGIILRSWLSSLAVNPGKGGYQCRKILCKQVNAFKATRWSHTCGRLSHRCWTTAMQMQPYMTNYRCCIVWGSG